MSTLINPKQAALQARYAVSKLLTEMSPDERAALNDPQILAPEKKGENRRLSAYRVWTDPKATTAGHDRHATALHEQDVEYALTKADEAQEAEEAELHDRIVAEEAVALLTDAERATEAKHAAKVGTNWPPEGEMPSARFLASLYHDPRSMIDGKYVDRMDELVKWARIGTTEGTGQSKTITGGNYGWVMVQLQTSWRAAHEALANIPDLNPHGCNAKQLKMLQVRRSKANHAMRIYRDWAQAVTSCCEGFHISPFAGGYTALVAPFSKEHQLALLAIAQDYLAFPDSWTADQVTYREYPHRVARPVAGEGLNPYYIRYVQLGEALAIVTRKSKEAEKLGALTPEEQIEAKAEIALKAKAAKTRMQKTRKAQTPEQKALANEKDAKRKAAKRKASKVSPDIKKILEEV